MSEYNNLLSVLSSEDFPGIGDKLADNLISTFGVNGLISRLRDRKVSDLISVPGIGPDKAGSIIQRVSLLPGLIELALFLDASGVKKKCALRLYNVWGADSLDIIKSNPYVLLAVMDWDEVDGIGRHLGNPFHPCRVVGAIEWSIYQDYEENQNTCTNHDTLSKMVQELIACDEKTFERGLEIALLTHAVVKHLGMYQAPAVHWYERLLENFLANNDKTKLTEAEVDTWIDGSQHKSLNSAQRTAVKNALLNRISAYCGRGGRGKTFTLSAIASGANALLKKKRIILSAVAAKAVKRMQIETQHPPEHCRTIAGLVYKERKENLRDSLIIIDEASMLSLLDAFRLLRKLPQDAHIVMLGDHNQIPSIQAGKLFYDIISSDVVPNVELTESHRHDKKTDEQLKAVLDGEFPVLDEFPDLQNSVEAPESGLYRRLVKPPQKWADPALMAEDEAINLYTQFLELGETVQVISPLRDIQYTGSSESINAKMHRVIFDDQGFCVHTPVVWTENKNVEGGDTNLSNGSVGVVRKVLGHALEVEFEHEGLVTLQNYEVKDYLEKAYCLSVHRAQGSEWDNVIIVLPKSKTMVDRNMVYTALSRCKKRSIIIYADHTFVERKVNAPAAHERRRSVFLQKEAA